MRFSQSSACFSVYAAMVGEVRPYLVRACVYQLSRHHEHMYISV